jgi:hypothetical protein
MGGYRQVGLHKAPDRSRVTPVWNVPFRYYGRVWMQAFMAIG